MRMPARMGEVRRKAVDESIRRRAMFYHPNQFSGLRQVPYTDIGDASFLHGREIESTHWESGVLNIRFKDGTGICIDSPTVLNIREVDTRKEV